MTDTVERLPIDVINHSLYVCWINLKERCLNPRNPDFKTYGGRGIKSCDSWLHEKYGFEHFLEDIPPRVEQKNPLTGYSIWTLDRIDSNGHYEPDNVKWSTWKEQQRNRRPRKKKERKMSVDES